MLLDDIFAAYYDARRNKRNTANQLKFELRLEENLVRLYQQIEARTYRVGRSVGFIIEVPVKREVFAASFKDRVVHHLYFNYVNEIFERAFIADSYSCRKGKGTSYGIARLDHHIRSCSDNYRRDAWALKLDLSGYFMSIDRQILYDKVYALLNKYAGRRNSQGVLFSEALDYDLLMYLTREIIFHDPLENCLIRGDMSEWEGLPPEKSLFGMPEGCGLPIGNLTSQLFSNVYLNDFDHYVKRELKFVHYGRYVDDFYLIHTSKPELVQAIGKIRNYLRDTLGIKLHPHKIYLQHIRHGVPFLGVVVKPHRTYIAHRTAGNFKRTMSMEETRTDPGRMVEVLNSYLGLMSHHKTFRLRHSVVRRNPWVFEHGWVDVNYRKFRYEKEI
jgi:retron-type reverse transcriptase